MTHKNGQRDFSGPHSGIKSGGTSSRKRHTPDRNDRAGNGCRRAALHVEIGDLERVGLDKLATRLDDVAHKRGENILLRLGVADPHL